MIGIIAHKNYNLTFSALLIIASLSAVAIWGLKLGIDFTGGTLAEYEFKNATLTTQETHQELQIHGFEAPTVQTSGEARIIIRLKPLDEAEHQRLLGTLREAIEKKGGTLEEKSFESIGPSVGAEFRKKAILAIVIAIVAIIAYIAYSFRKVSKPVASWKYGVCAAIALAHDVTIPLGVFAFLGHFHGWEVDMLFITGLLTVLGFSVHDTIVVFDRIRENLLRMGTKNFDEVANVSVNQTIARSINTSLTALIVLFALFFMGGETTRQFMLVLILGIFFGTYSSIFVASPLLVIWNNLNKK